MYVLFLKEMFPFVAKIYKTWTLKNWNMAAETFMQKVFKFKNSTDDYSLVVDRRKI